MELFRTKIFVFCFFFIGTVSSVLTSSYVFQLSKSRKRLSIFLLKTVESGVYECGLHCMKYRRCNGFQHAFGSCRLYGDKKKSTEIGQNVNQSEMFKVIAGRAVIGSLCLSTHDCNYKHGQCLRGKCACVIGYSYDFDKDECVTSCRNYGWSFSMYHDSAVGGCNIRKYKTSGGTECMMRCRDEPRFLCITSEYWPGDKTCCLCNRTWHSIKAYNRQDDKAPGYVMYYRNCQD